MIYQIFDVAAWIIGCSLSFAAGLGMKLGLEAIEQKLHQTIRDEVKIVLNQMERRSPVK